MDCSRRSWRRGLPELRAFGRTGPGGQLALVSTQKLQRWAGSDIRTSSRSLTTGRKTENRTLLWSIANLAI